MSQIFLILVHKNPRQLRRLINRLTDQDSKFVLHIDVDSNEEEFRSYFQDRIHDVFFLNSRVSSKWGSFEMIEATLNGLQFINQNILCAERVTLLSGQDYPIKPIKQIKNFFKRNQNSIYIEYFSIPCKYWWNRGLSRFPLFESISEMIHIYGGSQWWSMPMFVVKRILSDLTDYPDFTTYFKSVNIPDESFFQTLLLNSDDNEIITNIINDNLRFISWQPPYLRPNTIFSNDLRKLSRSDKFFARKFDDEVDTSILNEIDNFLLDSKNARQYKKQIRGLNRHSLQAVLLLTNKLSSRSKFDTLKQVLNNSVSTFLLYHETDVNSITKHNSEEVFKFDDSILYSLGFEPIGNNLLPGSNHFPLFSFFHSYPYYDYYWLIEDDVFYNGNWSDLFDAFSPEKINAGFISSHIRTSMDDPSWYWWNTLKGKNNSSENKLKFKLASFNPIYRISNEAVRFLESKMKEGWMGHHETLLPTLLYNAGFPIVDFGGNGQFCFYKKANNFYKNNLCTIQGKNQHSSMRYRPLITPSEISESLLYHPVKFDFK